MKMTQNERRRMYLAQQAARQAMIDRLKQPVAVDTAVNASAVRRRWLKTVAIATLIGSGPLAYSVVQLHPPTSIEAFPPRLQPALRAPTPRSRPAALPPPPPTAPRS